MKTRTHQFIKEFFRLESASGIILLIAAVAAVICANTPLESLYGLLLKTPVEIRIGALHIAKPLLLWINDGLMAVFFFLVGLELKRELLEGELSDIRNVILPGVGAVGGMVVPALIYVYCNADDPIAMQGWAIPAATDIAFALGILALLGSKVPISIKIFLTSLAIFDDIGAIVIIALFYTANISTTALVVASCCLPILALLNMRGVSSKSVYMAFGVIMWTAMLKSGVHATLAGVLLAMFIPMKSNSEPDHSPLKELEHDLHSVVAFLILPAFAFANAGINFSGVGPEELLHPVSLGIVLGLFAGKQIGIFTFCWAAVKFRLTRLPHDINWGMLYGTAALCGIGFTMSLFIGSLAFEDTKVNQLFDQRLGIIFGSLLSGATGYIVLRLNLNKREQQIGDDRGTS